MWWLIGAVIWHLGCVLATQYVAWQKGRPLVEGFFLGTTLGPVGALVEALLPDESRSWVENDEWPPRSPMTRRPPSAAIAETIEVDPSSWR